MNPIDPELLSRGRRFEAGYRDRFRRANFLEILALLAAFHHLSVGETPDAG